MKTRLLSAVLVAVATGACASFNAGTRMIEAPRFREVADKRAQVTLPSSGTSGEANVRLYAEVRNPNSSRLKLEKVRGSLFLEGQQAAKVELPLDLELKPREEAEVPIDVTVRLDKSPALAQALARSAEGPAVGYRMDGTLQVETDQGEPVFGPLTLLEGEARVH